MGSALVHREGRLGDNGGNRCPKLGGCYRLRRTTRRPSLGVALFRRPASRGRIDHGATRSIFPAPFSSKRFSLRPSRRRAKRSNAQRCLSLDAPRPRSLGTGRPAHPLPKARAAEALATLIARLPIRRTLSSDDLAISQRLVELLPDQKSAPLQGRERVGAGQKKYWQAMVLLAGLALGAAILFSAL